MKFERGQEVKEALGIGLASTAMDVSGIRFIIVDGPKLIWNGLNNNVESCFALNEKYTRIILERLEQGTYQNAQLLEIREETKVIDDIIEKPLSRWHLGNGLKGRVVRYKKKYYCMPE